LMAVNNEPAADESMDDLLGGFSAAPAPAPAPGGFDPRGFSAPGGFGPPGGFAAAPAPAQVDFFADFTGPPQQNFNFDVAATSVPASAPPAAPTPAAETNFLGDDLSGLVSLRGVKTKEQLAAEAHQVKPVPMSSGIPMKSQVGTGSPQAQMQAGNGMQQFGNNMGMQQPAMMRPGMHQPGMNPQGMMMPQQTMPNMMMPQPSMMQGGQQCGMGMQPSMQPGMQNGFAGMSMQGTMGMQQNTMQPLPTMQAGMRM